MAAFNLEVDVVVDRSARPWRSRTHHVTVLVDDDQSPSRADNEARNLAAWMCWHIRGDMVTSVRIISVEL